MALFKCKMCGGDLVLTEGNPLAECEYCGSLQTVPSADNEKKLTLFGRANRLRFACEFDKAAGVYEAIVADFPLEAEAYWGLVLCKYGIEYVDDPASGKKVPTCHRSSFDSVMEDSDFEQTVENADSLARKVYREEAKQIEELRKGILEVSSKEDPYDIFICYKETAENGERTIDSVIAQDVYDALIEKGYRVFFSRITLEDKLGQEYEPYIFAALNSAKVMLAFGTDYDYFNAVWVRNEWSRYLKLMGSDKSKHLIPCYKGIDAYDMPKEFSKLQAQDLGKVGAVQDLLRGIDKLISPSEKEVPVATASVDVIEVTLKKAYEFLNAEDWDAAKKCLDTVIGYDPYNVSALIGCLMLKLHIPQEKKLANHGRILENEEYYQQAIRFADKETKLRLEEYNRSSVYNCAMAESKKLGGAKAAIRKLESISGWRDADEQAKLLKKKQKKAKTQRRYIAAGFIVLLLIGSYFSLGLIRQNIINDLYAGSISAEKAYNLLLKWEWYQETDDTTKFVIARQIEDAYPGIETPSEFIVPNGVTSIDSSAFSKCTNLTSITLPNSLTSIGEAAFAGCTGLTSITLPKDLASIGDRAFHGCTGLTSITLPNSLTSFGNSVFYGCSGLTAIEIPRGVTDIDSTAFQRCINLTSVTFSNTVTRIGSLAFSGCKNLSSVTFSEGLTTIESSAFYGCSGLTSIALPNSVTDIGNSAFSDCTGLTSITIPSSVTSIGDSAFKNCVGLTSVTIPSSVTHMGAGVFTGCDENLQIYIDREKKLIGWSARWFGSIAADNIHWEKD